MFPLSAADLVYQHEPASNIEEPSKSEPSESGEDSSDEETSGSEIFLNYMKNSSLRNARDLALMAEERWLIEVLKATRQQRNALKVEALYYQGLKASLLAHHAAAYGETSTDIEMDPVLTNNTDMTPIPEPTYPELDIDLDQPYSQRKPLTTNEDILKKLKKIGEKELAVSNVADFNLHEEQCNLEELRHLTVNIQKNMETWGSEDPEYESDDEDEWSRVNLDMSMLVGDSDHDADQDVDHYADNDAD